MDHPSQVDAQLSQQHHHKYEALTIPKKNHHPLVCPDTESAQPAYCEHTPRMKEHLDSALGYHHQEQEPFGNR
jgi:hypothetical protein